MTSTNDVPKMPEGPTAQQNPALIADAMSKLITYIGEIILHRANDPTYIAPAQMMQNIRIATTAIGSWSMSVSDGMVSSHCTVLQGEPDAPPPVEVIIEVYGLTWTYRVDVSGYKDISNLD